MKIVSFTGVIVAVYVFGHKFRFPLAVEIVSVYSEKAGPEDG